MLGFKALHCKLGEGNALERTISIGNVVSKMVTSVGEITLRLRKEKFFKEKVILFYFPITVLPLECVFLPSKAPLKQNKLLALKMTLNVR